MKEEELIPRMALEYLVVNLSSKKGWNPRAIEITRKVMDLKQFGCFQFIIAMGAVIECFGEYVCENGDTSNEFIISKLCNSLRHGLVTDGDSADSSGSISKAYFDKIFNKGRDD